MKNTNTREELEEVKIKVLQHLSNLPPVSVNIHTCVNNLGPPQTGTPQV